MDATTQPETDAVLEQLERIVASPDFDSSVRAREFMRYVVGALAAGREAEISQHAIAMTVFGRGSDFDPATDPIVRMQAGRVRRSLEHYYLTEGADDPVIISLPKGTYVPVFQLRALVEPLPSPPKGIQPQAASTELGPTLLVTPFQNMTGDPGMAYITEGLAFDLAIALSDYREFRVIHAPSNGDHRPTKANTQFEIKGAVADREDRLKVSAQILDTSSQQQLWGASYLTDRSGPVLGRFMDELAQTLAAAIASEEGLVAQHIAGANGRRRTAELDAYEAILRYRHFSRSPSPQSYQAAITALQNAVKSHPESGHCWSFLGRLYAEDYAMGISAGPSLIQDALRFARKGVQLNPTDRRARAVLSYVHLLNGQVDEARREAEAALELKPNSLMLVCGIGYLLTMSGDWEHGPELSRKAIRLNPFHLSVVHVGLWLDALHRKDFEEALRQALEFMTPDNFWDPLMEAVPLAFLERHEQAAGAIDQLLQLKPEFQERGHWLITRYVKLGELVELIENGLEKAGLQVKRT